MDKFKTFMKENKLLCLFFVFLITTIILYDDNSFLFKYTVQHDEGVYWNVAKEMFKGKIPYKDIYDHKGPFIFFIYQLLHLISIPGTTSGVFLYDLICVAFSFYFIYKTNALFHNKTENLIILSLVYIFFINTWFRYGGVPELLVMSLYSYLIYWLFSKKYKEDNLKSLYFITVLSGIIFWLKFNLIIVPGILFLFYLVQVIIKEKKYKNLLHCFIGFIIPIIIVLVYFIKNNALNYLFQVYFFDNLGYNGDALPSTFANFIIFICLSSIIFILNIFALKKYKDLKIEFFVFYICFLFLILFQFLISNRYYLYYFYPCIPLFSIMLFSLKLIDKYVISVIIFIVNIFLIINSPLLYDGNQHKTIFSQKSNAIDDLQDILNEGDNVFVLQASPCIINNFDVLNDFYFYFPNFTYEQNPELWESILDNIKNKNYDYIITRKYINGEFVTNYDSFVECNVDILNEIIYNMNINYQHFALSDFSTHLDEEQYYLLKKK